MRTVLLLLATVGLLIAALLSSPVGARSDDIEEITPPVPFHGTIACTGVISGGIPDIRPEVTFNRGEIYQAEGDVSDPRLQGSYTAFFNSDNYKSPDLTTSLGSGLWRIENEAGAWQGSYNVIGLPFEGSVRTSTTTTILVGEGEYEGLLAVWEVDFDNRACEWTVNGLVVEGELPPTPDVVSTPTNDPP